VARAETHTAGGARRAPAALFAEGTAWCVAHPRRLAAESLRRGPVSIGDVMLVMIPEQESEMVNLLISFMDEPREVSVIAYQGLGGGGGELVGSFLGTAKRLGLNPRRLGDLENQAFRVFFRQLIHNISGIPLEAIRADDLVDFERALRRLRSA